MITTGNLPKGYMPYQDLNFCSNTILGGGQIFEIGKVIPLLIGAGPSPRVWLQAVAAPGNKDFVMVVADSVSVHPAVDVSVKENKVVVSVKGNSVLTVEAIGEQRAVVSKIDFRPLGLNIFGNSDALSLGGTKLSHNTISGVGIAFSLGA